MKRLGSFFFLLIGGGRGGPEPDGPAVARVCSPASLVWSAEESAEALAAGGADNGVRMAVGGLRASEARGVDRDTAEDDAEMLGDGFPFWLATKARGVCRFEGTVPSTLAGSPNFLGVDFGINTGGGSIVLRWKKDGST